MVGFDSDRHYDFPGTFQSADRLASPAIRHASVDQAALDFAVTEAVLDKIDWFAGIEEICGDAVAQ